MLAQYNILLIFHYNIYNYEKNLIKFIDAIHITLDLINGSDKITIAIYDRSIKLSFLERYLYNGYFDTAILSGSNLDVNGNVKANTFIKSGGLSSEFLMAAGTNMLLYDDIETHYQAVELFGYEECPTPVPGNYQYSYSIESGNGYTVIT